MRKHNLIPAFSLALVIGSACAATLLWTSDAPSAPPPPGSGKPAPPVSPDLAKAPQDPDPEKIAEAVARGLQWLRSQQDATTGGWMQDVGYKRGSSYVVTEESKPHVGVSSLALMAFLSGGHLPGRGEHARVVERGTDFVLETVHPESGYISGAGTRMYSHAFATLFLAEIYGMTHREDVKQKLQQAVDLTVDSQNKLGSWRYLPYSSAADMSITACQIMALRAARNVGIRVPKITIDRAYEYVSKSAQGRRTGRNYGGFRYKLSGGGDRTTFALTAAGIATLNHSGIYDHELIEGGFAYLQRTLPSYFRRHRGHYFYWYGNYYASQAFFLSTVEGQDLWAWYWPRIVEDLLSYQQADGSWPNTTGPGRAFSTAVACIILQIPNQYLPIFSR